MTPCYGPGMRTHRASWLAVATCALLVTACGQPGGTTPATGTATTSVPPTAATTGGVPTGGPTATPAATTAMGTLPVGQIVYMELSGGTEGPYIGTSVLGMGVPRHLQLPFATEGFTGSWSPDGKRLAVSSFANEHEVIGILDVATGAWTEIKPKGMTGELECSDWQPQGDLLVCSRGAPDPADDGLYTVTIGTGATQRLTTSPYHYVTASGGDCGGGEGRAVWDGSGTRLAYEQQKCGTGDSPSDNEQGDIAVITAPGATPNVIVPLGGVRTHPGGEISWSPTADVIAYATQDGRLATIPVGGGEPTFITLPVPGFVYGPAWSPDGKWLLVAIRSLANAQTDLYVVAPDGSTAIQLTNSPEVEAFTDWGPGPAP